MEDFCTNSIFIVFIDFLSIVRLRNYHKSKENQILMRFDVFGSLLENPIIDFWPSGTTWGG